MKPILLDDLLKSANYYSGDIWFVELQIRNETQLVSFLRMPLYAQRNLFPNKNFKYGIKHPAVYLITNKLTNQTYVGSTNYAYNRICGHKSYLLELDISRGSRLLKENLKTTTSAYFDLTVLFLKDRDDCYDLEQILINKFIKENLSFNIATDSRKSALGLKHSETTKRIIGEHSLRFPRIISDEGKQKKIEASKRWVRTDEIKRKIADSNRGIPCSPEKKAKLKLNCFKPYKPIEINGIKYAGIKEAVKMIKISKDTLRKRIISSQLIYSGYKYVS